ncbi:putative phosphatase [Polaromonas vacuolata]|uniref:Putative phosphatase n=1 Tax=Polaromonas vacuolata TaxID=37448 RepID=A0A6H2HD65_9BURK|nr:HAD-IB family hydrolase [Polaromonas vacuolata]QJC57829.1 putative phosphatase [Polaromonas vacuolata]
MSIKPRPVVAAFDFDGTLTRHDTFVPFLIRGLGWPRFAWVIFLCLPWLIGFALRVVSNHKAKQKLMLLALKGRTMAQMKDWTQRWLAKDFWHQLRPDAMAQLLAHQQAGHCCVMVSASPDIYLREVAQQLGFDHLICTEMAVKNGVFNGLMQSPNCHGEQKVVRLKAWLALRFEVPLEAIELHAYGDTYGDKPMLRMAAHAWYRGQPWQDE